MLMLTIDIPDEGVWNAVTCEGLGPNYVVLENFRVHPFADGIVRRRTTSIDPTVLRLEKDTPVTVDGEDAVVLLPYGDMHWIERVSDGVVTIASNDRISYRMNMTIDDIGGSSYTTMNFGSYLYVVPKDAMRPHMAPTKSTLPSIYIPVNDDDENENKEDDGDWSVTDGDSRMDPLSPIQKSTVHWRCCDIVQGCTLRYRHTGICNAVVQTSRKRTRVDMYVPEKTNTPKRKVCSTRAVRVPLGS